jgi:hypothetical protein
MIWIFCKSPASFPVEKMKTAPLKALLRNCTYLYWGYRQKMNRFDDKRLYDLEGVFFTGAPLEYLGEIEDTREIFRPG